VRTRIRHRKHLQTHRFQSPPLRFTGEETRTMTDMIRSSCAGYDAQRGDCQSRQSKRPHVADGVLGVAS
jgi:hypothetical protein